MRTFLLSLVFLLLGSGNLEAQNIRNLVPNPSFESLRNLPVKDNPKNTFEYEPLSGYIPYKVNLKNWFAASKTTPDLRINSPSMYYDCQRRFKNCDKAKTGINCVGIITSMTNSKVKTYREYVQIKLIEKLRPNELAYVELWIAKERQAKLVSNNLGFHFSTKRISKDTKEVIELIPQINIDTVINRDKKRWVKLSGSFIPDKPYDYLLIGNFFDNSQTETIVFENYNGSPYTPPYAYYLLDDVKVWQDEELLVFEDSLVRLNEPISLKNIEFDFDKATLKASSIQELEKLYSFMLQNNGIRIKIQGHTDAFGAHSYNQELSERRAQRVYDYLIEKGIPASRMLYEGFGEHLPLLQDLSETSRSRNRRVEFLIIGNDSL